MESTLSPFAFPSFSRIEPHPEHLPINFGVREEDERLARSIERFGLLCPLIVIPAAENRYRILDGHRRYYCAERLNLSSAYCHILPAMEADEYEYRRFLIHETVEPWTQAQTAR